jgi:hypothetical protein
MTKTLTWRLSKLPTVEELQQLVKDKIITKEEAKDVLFKDKEEDKKELVNAQAEEIKFLKELVEKLANGNSAVIIKQIERVRGPYELDPWYVPYNTWSVSGGHGVAYASTTGGNALTVDGTSVASITTSSEQSYMSSDPIPFSSI